MPFISSTQLSLASSRFLWTSPMLLMGLSTVERFPTRSPEVLNFFSTTLTPCMATRNGVTAKSYDGIIQGETLSSLFVCLTIDYPPKELAANSRSISIRAYVEDIAITGPSNALKNANDCLRDSLSHISFVFSPAKQTHIATGDHHYIMAEQSADCSLSCDPWCSHWVCGLYFFVVGRAHRTCVHSPHH